MRLAFLKKTNERNRRNKCDWEKQQQQKQLWRVSVNAFEYDRQQIYNGFESINCLFHSSLTFIITCSLLYSYSVAFLIHIFLQRISKQAEKTPIANRIEQKERPSIPNKSIVSRIRFFLAYQIKRPGCSQRGIRVFGLLLLLAIANMRLIGICVIEFSWLFIRHTFCM